MKLLVQKGYGQSCGYKYFLNDVRNTERFIETKKNKTVKVYPFVVRRMTPLFEKKNYTNVKALAIIPC